jgi:hypothetical protein
VYGFEERGGCEGGAFELLLYGSFIFGVLEGGMVRGLWPFTIVNKVSLIYIIIDTLFYLFFKQYIHLSLLSLILKPFSMKGGASPTIARRINHVMINDRGKLPNQSKSDD